jgi:anti-sigma factor (TIGR02949 family)
MARQHGPASEECRAVFARLSEYIDGELQADLCTRLEGHMDDCPPCQAFLESIRRTVRLLHEVEAPPLPEEIRRSVREAYRRYRREVGGD